MEEALALEPFVDAAAAKLERRLLAARQTMLTAAGRAVAADRFAELWDDVARLLDAEGQLSTAGFYLDALTFRRRRADAGTVGQIAARVTALFERLLVGQVTVPARRRVREVFQRPIESAAAALLTMAELVGQGGGQGQAMLRQLWGLICATRNVELRVAAGARAVDAERERLEERFHRHLRDALRAGTPAQRWEAALADLLEREQALREAGPGEVRAGEPLPAPPPDGSALLFFQFRELSTERPLLLLAQCAGRLFGSQVSHSEAEVLEPLAHWREALLEGEERPASEALEAVVGSLFYPLLQRPEAEAGAPIWWLLPDGALTEAPFESLPTPGRPERALGEGAAIRVLLRSAVAVEERRVAFERGWLGVAAAPPGGAPLPGSAREIEAIAHGLRRRGVAVTILTGSDATAARLRRRLQECAPAVVHLAVHGHADREWPEACALLLMPDPAGAEGELLPFRRIAELDLAGVELVVLSACASGIGRSRRAEGLRGLAWAFLQAGAGQVVASRWPVGDAATGLFMDLFYRRLHDHPPAEALRRCRRDARELGLSRREVAAWGVWC